MLSLEFSRVRVNMRTHTIQEIFGRERLLGAADAAGGGGGSVSIEQLGSSEGLGSDVSRLARGIECSNTRLASLWGEDLGRLPFVLGCTVLLSLGVLAPFHGLAVDRAPALGMTGAVKGALVCLKMHRRRFVRDTLDKLMGAASGSLRIASLSQYDDDAVSQVLSMKGDSIDDRVSEES